MSPFGLITVACVLAASISVATSARSAGMCDAIAEFTEQTAEARDVGVPKAAVMAVIAENEPIVADFMRQVADRVYSNDLPPVALREVMRASCEQVLR